MDDLTRERARVIEALRLYMAARRAMVDALRQPQRLSEAEVRDFLQRAIYMGRPLLQRGARGPTSKSTQYDLAGDRRRRTLGTMERPQRVRAARALAGDRTRTMIETALALVPAGTPARELARAVADALARNGAPDFDIATIRRYLRSAKKNPR